MKTEEEKIVAYLLGELPVEEEAAVRDAINKDPQLQTAVADYQRLLTGFRQERVQRYANEVLEETPPDNSSHGNRKPWLWLILIGVIIVSGITWSLQFSSKTSEQLAQEYFILPADPTVAGQNNSRATYQEGINAFFRERDYFTAATAFARLQGDSLLGQRALFYLGHTRFLTQDYERAETLLSTSLSQGGDFSRFEQQDLAWNILMARLAQGENIRSDLQALPDREGKQSLLNQLPE